MKKFIILGMALMLILTVNGIGMTASSLSQDANIYAEVLSPVTISTLTDLNFGTLAASSQNPGTVTIMGDGSFVNTEIPYHDDTNGSLASFSVEYPEYANRLNQNVIQPQVNITSGANTMVVSAFQLYNMNTATTNQITTFSFDVGATLQVAANQPAGSYVGTFDVTVTFE